MAPKSAFKVQSSTAIVPYMKPFLTSRTPPSMRNPVEAQPFARTRKLVRSTTEPMMVQMGNHFTTRPSTSIVSPLKQIFELEAGVSRSQPITQVAKPDWGRRMCILDPGTYVVPKYDPFSDWRLAVGAQPSRILNSKLAQSESRSNAKLILPATFPSTDTSRATVLSTPSPVAHVVSDTPPPALHLVCDTSSPTKRNLKLQDIQTKVAKQAQQLKEATSRASKATKMLCNNWRHDAKFRHWMKAKRQAEKTVRFLTYELHASRKEVVNSLSM